MRLIRFNPDRLPRQHDPLRQQDRAVQAFFDDLAVFGAERDGVFQPDRAFVGEPPDAEHFGGAPDDAVAERWHRERDEDQAAGYCKLEMTPDGDLERRYYVTSVLFRFNESS